VIVTLVSPAGSSEEKLVVAVPATALRTTPMAAPATIPIAICQ